MQSEKASKVFKIQKNKSVFSGTSARKHPLQSKLCFSCFFLFLRAVAVRQGLFCAFRSVRTARVGRVGFCLVNQGESLSDFKVFTPGCSFSFRIFFDTIQQGLFSMVILFMQIL